MFHLMAVHGADGRRRRRYETDRARFIGRGRTLADAAAMHRPAPLSGQRRARCSIRSSRSAASSRSSPDETVTRRPRHRRRRDARGVRWRWSRSTTTATSPTACSSWPGRTARSCCASSTPPRPTRSSSSGSPARCSTPTPRCAPTPACSLRNRRGQSGLWGYGISGDLPIVLLQIGDAASIELVRQLVQAHAYWRLKGLAVDLVIWNEDRAGYRQRAAGADHRARSPPASRRTLLDRPGGIFVRRADQISDEDRVLLQAVARVIVSDTRRHARRAGAAPAARRERRPPPLRRRRARAERRARAAPRRRRGACATLAFFNGLGGFTPDGREYVIAPPPARGRRRRGSTCSPTRASARVVTRERAAPTPGARTRTSSASRRGTTTRSATRRRGVLPARRGDAAQFWSPTAACPSCGDGAPYVDPPRLRLQRVRARRGTASAAS